LIKSNAKNPCKMWNAINKLRCKPRKTLPEISSLNEQMLADMFVKAFKDKVDEAKDRIHVTAENYLDLERSKKHRRILV
jgi:hypothetical protein